MAFCRMPCATFDLIRYLAELKHFKHMCDTKFGKRAINTIYFGGEFMKLFVYIRY
jgi:hypothetical protein